MMATPASADGVTSTSCVGRWLWGSCVTISRRGISDPHIRHVPQPTTEAEIAASHERERVWREHCQPQVRQDYFGVARYVYAAPGCEYGRVD
jgi:hypothetical protein